MKLNKRWQPILLTTLALAMIPVALTYTDYAISNQAQPEKMPEKIIAPRVTVLPISTGSYNSVIQAFGEVRAVDEISLSSQLTGRVVWRNAKFAVGGRINKGEVLIRIDDTDFQTALANAKQAEAEAALALQQEERQRDQAARDWQRSGIKAKPGALALREPQLKVAQSRYQAAKAAVVQAKRDLALTQLKAPFAAVIVQRNAALGSYVESGTVVATLRASDQAEVALSLSANQWQQLPDNPVGLPVVLQSRDQNGVQWQGRVQRLSATIDANTRQRSLIVVVDQPLDQAPPLLFGSFVGTQIQGAQVPDLFALPASALTADGYIWYVSDQTLQRARRAPLFSNAGQIFIPQGELPDRIQLVRKPMSGYLPDMRVQPHVAGGGR